MYICIDTPFCIWFHHIHTKNSIMETTRYRFVHDQMKIVVCCDTHTPRFNLCVYIYMIYRLKGRLIQILKAGEEAMHQRLLRQQQLHQSQWKSSLPRRASSRIALTRIQSMQRHEGPLERTTKKETHDDDEDDEASQRVALETIYIYIYIVRVCVYLCSTKIVVRVTYE